MSTVELISDDFLIDLKSAKKSPENQVDSAHMGASAKYQAEKWQTLEINYFNPGNDVGRSKMKFQKTHFPLMKMSFF